MPKQPPQVGAPDPELDNSPILDEEEDELPQDVEDLESGVCRFNGVAYRPGDYVLSGDELLRCEKGGIWVRKGEMRPE